MKNAFRVMITLIFLHAVESKAEISVTSNPNVNVNTLSGRLVSTGYDPQIKSTVTRPLGNTPISVKVFNTTFNSTTNQDGNFNFADISASSAASLTVELEVIYKSTAVQIINPSGQQLTHRQNITINNLSQSLELKDGSIAAYDLAAANEYVGWIKSQALFGPLFNTVKIEIRSFGAWTSGNKITLGEDLFDQGPLLHELGHVILFSHGIDISESERFSVCNATASGCYLTPDGILAKENITSLTLHEEFADFFGAAMLDRVYGAQYRMNSGYIGRYELNIGGRDVYFGSETAAYSPYNNYVGTQRDPDGKIYYIYPLENRKPNSGADSTVLWDLYDDAPYNGIYEVIRNILSSDPKTLRWDVSFPSRLANINFTNPQYNAINNLGYFTQAAMFNRETSYDRLSVDIPNITRAIVKYGNQQHLNARARISKELDSLLIPREKFADLMRLHSTYIRLKSAAFPKYLRHANAQAKISSLTSPLDQYDSEWKLAPSLIEPTNPDLVSIESVNYPGTYLRHANSLIYQHYDDGSALFAKDASWKIATSGSEPRVSTFESYNYPSFYLTIDTEDGGLKLMHNTAKALAFRQFNQKPVFLGPTIPADYSNSYSGGPECTTNNNSSTGITSARVEYKVTWSTTWNGQGVCTTSYRYSLL